MSNREPYPTQVSHFQGAGSAAGGGTPAGVMFNNLWESKTIKRPVWCLRGGPDFGKGSFAFHYKDQVLVSIVFKLL